MKTKQYWLLKSEEGCYSIDDFQMDKKASWTDVRNYQARNFIRDEMKRGDMILFYHSNSNPTAVVGVGKIVSDAYPDPTAFDKKSEYFDPKSKKEKPTWFARDIQFVKKLKNPVTLFQIKLDPAFKGIAVAQKGSRLSILPVSQKHFELLASK
jgi:predicted RNA-binding protein with PUA-like domain